VALSVLQLRQYAEPTGWKTRLWTGVGVWSAGWTEMFSSL